MLLIWIPNILTAISEDSLSQQYFSSLILVDLTSSRPVRFERHRIGVTGDAICHR